MPDEPSFAEAAFVVFYINLTINGLASLITLCLMFSMWRAGRLKLNIFTKCAIQMAFFQLIYEVAAPIHHIMLRVAPFATVSVMTTGGLFLGGTGASVWSLMMLFSVLFTVHYSRQPNPKEQLISCVIVNLLLIAFAVQAMVRCQISIHNADGAHAKRWIQIFNGYNIGRIVFIVLSGICLLRLYQIMLRTSQSLKVARSRIPLFHLLKKIVPYTIILAVARFGASAYQWIYNTVPTGNLTANADGWRIFWLYVFVLLTPAASLGFLVSFVRATPGATRSLIEMLHLECIFTLPDAPASWAENNNISRRLDGESTMRPTTMQEENIRLATMDEGALATAVAIQTRDSCNAGRMSEQEEGVLEKEARKVDLNAGLHEI